MNFKSLFLFLSLVGILPLRNLKIQFNTSLIEDEEADVEDLNSLTFEMISDGLSFSGSSNTLQIRFSLMPSEIHIDGLNLKILSECFYGNDLLVNIENKSRFSKLSINYNDENNQKHVLNYYLYKKDVINFVSSTSIDDAISLTGDDPNIVNSPISKSIIDLPDPVVNYKGRIQWKDDFGTIYPLVGAKVCAQLKDNLFNTKIVKAVYTDSNGFFDLGLTSATAVKNTFDLYLSSQFVNVFNVDNSESNSTIGFDGRSQLYKMNLEAYTSNLYKNLPIVINSNSKNEFGSNFGQAVQIFECMYYYSVYARRKIVASDLTLCKVYYPCKYDYSVVKENNFRKFSTPFYRRNYNAIYLPTLDKRIAGSNYEVYQSWDAIGHEYGHHIGYITKFCPSNIEGTHYSNKDDVKTITGNSSIAPTDEQINNGLVMAWKESWPTYWSQIAQASFSDELKENYPTLANQKYEAYNFRDGYFISHEENFNDTEKTKNICGGDAFERGIMRFLYEVNRAIGGYSSLETVSTDNLWNLLKDYVERYSKANPDDYPTFSFFYDFLYSDVLFNGKIKHLTLNKLYSITANYWISPIKVSTSKISNKIRITWTQGGNYENENPIQYGYIQYFDKNGNILQQVDLNVMFLGKRENEFYWFSADISEPYFDQDISVADIHKVVLNYSPRAYKGTNGYFYCSYPRVIWEGDNFSIDKFSSINLDQEVKLRC